MASSASLSSSAHAWLMILVCVLQAPCHAHDASAQHRDTADGKLAGNPSDRRGIVAIEVEPAAVEHSFTSETSWLGPSAASINPQDQQTDASKLKAAAALEPRAMAASASSKQAANGSNDQTVDTRAEYRSPRRSLLPSGTVIKDQTQELSSHVVRIRSQSNGEGTGLLLKKNFVLTAKRVVQGFLDPFEFSLQLGNETSHGLELFLHPAQDLAVIKVHPPFEHTGRAAMAASPKGFFWPLLKQDPGPPGSLKLFGYGASAGFPTKDYLTYQTFPLSRRSITSHLVVSTKGTIAVTSRDAGGPAFVVRKEGSRLAGVITASKPREGEMVSVAQNREWVYEAMKSTCSREEQTFKRLLVGTEADILIYYHCRVERAERLGLHLTMKTAPCAAGWKSVRLLSSHGKLLAKVETHDRKDVDTVILTPKSLRSIPHFFIELWKLRLHGMQHTMASRYGPFNVSDFMDGGLHFEWCES